MSRKKIPGFYPRRKIRCARIHGRLVRPGDLVQILRPGYGKGIFRGKSNGKLAVNVHSLHYFPTQLLLLPCEIRLLEPVNSSRSVTGGVRR
jgi:hypothetical protein